MDGRTGVLAGGGEPDGGVSGAADPAVSRGVPYNPELTPDQRARVGEIRAGMRAEAARPELHWGDEISNDTPWGRWVRIRDRATGALVEHVTLVRPGEGWCEVEIWENGQPKLVDDSFVCERRTDPFTVELREDAPESALEWFAIPTGDRQFDAGGPDQQASAPKSSI